MIYYGQKERCPFVPLKEHRAEECPICNNQQTKKTT